MSLQRRYIKKLQNKIVQTTKYSTDEDDAEFTPATSIWYSNANSWSSHLILTRNLTCTIGTDQEPMLKLIMSSRLEETFCLLKWKHPEKEACRASGAICHHTRFHLLESGFRWRTMDHTMISVCALCMLHIKSEISPLINEHRERRDLLPRLV